MRFHRTELVTNCSPPRPATKWQRVRGRKRGNTRRSQKTRAYTFNKMSHDAYREASRERDEGASSATAAAAAAAAAKLRASLLPVHLPGRHRRRQNQESSMHAMHGRFAFAQARVPCASPIIQERAREKRSAPLLTAIPQRLDVRVVVSA